jgi:hypothetical protein
MFLAHQSTATLDSLVAEAPYPLSGGSWATCEKVDGDCMACPLLKELSPTATVHIRDDDLIQSAKDADTVISSLGPVNEFDKADTGLHTSLFYFCCHNLSEEAKMKKALQEMVWHSFDIVYDDIACNLDHNNKTIYLHALPTNQTVLFALTTQMEQVIAAAGVKINHPRKSMFHMTLARVNHSYPVDAAMNQLRGGHFGTHRMCSFDFAGVNISAADCK